MTTYTAHHQRDPEATPVLTLEVDDASGKITKVSKPEGKGLPSSVGLLGTGLGTRRAPTLAQWEQMNRNLVLKKSEAKPTKIEKTAYKLVTEQTGEDAGYILVDDDTQTLEGYAGEAPPVGYVQGQPLSMWLDANRGYKVEAIPEPVVEVGEDAEIDTSAETARLIGMGVAAGLQASGVISKADAEQQIVYGWAYITHDRNGEVVIDKSGDFVDDVEEIQKAAVDFMLHHRASDLDHTNIKGGEVIESMVFTPDKKKAMGIPPGVLPDGWWIGVKCSDEQWKGYKEGRTAFSIHGAGTRKAAD